MKTGACIVCTSSCICQALINLCSAQHCLLSGNFISWMVACFKTWASLCVQYKRYQGCYLYVVLWHCYPYV